MSITDPSICPECKLANTRYLKRIISPNGCYMVDRFVCRECGLIYAVSGETGKVIISKDQPLQEDLVKDSGISMTLRKDLS